MQEIPLRLIKEVHVVIYLEYDGSFRSLVGASNKEVRVIRKVLNSLKSIKFISSSRRNRAICSVNSYQNWIDPNYGLGIVSYQKKKL